MQWGLIAAVSLLVALHAWHFKALQDFGVFHRAGGRFSAGESLYRIDDGIECFKYAPPVAALFVPLAAISFKWSALLWMLISAATLVAFWRWSFKWYAPSAAPVWHLIAFVWLIPYLRFLFALGQCDLLVLCALALSETTAKKYPWASGLLWAAACLFKLPFLILLPLALLFREWKRIGGLIVGLAVGLALPSLRYGVGGTEQLLSEWRSLLAATTPPMLCGFDNQSLYGIVCRLGVAPESGLLFYGIVWTVALAVIIATGWVVIALFHRDRELARKVAFAIALYLSAFLSPLGWRSNLVALLPLFFLVAANWSALTRPVRIAVASFATLNTVIGLLVYDVIGKTAFNWLIVHRAIGFVALLFVATAIVGVLRSPATAMQRPREPLDARR
ncbi:MAG: glycosyltransferase family 87 protein [Myxococcaceae bacterium]